MHHTGVTLPSQDFQFGKGGERKQHFWLQAELNQTADLAHIEHGAVPRGLRRCRNPQAESTKADSPGKLHLKRTVERVSNLRGLLGLALLCCPAATLRVRDLLPGFRAQHALLAALSLGRARL